ncbi:hypothetical protein L596_010357 [Steinernema carpocapsae]|uniref:F-box associated domain-containing protein n=1 Tax=Steinernema carpocapsae TaxID=34508 RepID=A0A4U5PIU1_STECR|nr:hypothetical protein L596_010357 [Steinernema carpocapsae]
MDNVPFTFIDAVAHLLPKHFLIAFGELESNLWSSVGETHRKKRLDCVLSVETFNGETYSTVLGLDGVTYTLQDYANMNNSYKRVVGLCQYPRTFKKGKDDKAVLKSFLNLGHKINLVFDELYFSDSTKDLFLMPSKGIYMMSTIETTGLFFDWHFENNAILEELWMFTFDCQLKVIESWLNRPNPREITLKSDKEIKSMRSVKAKLVDLGVNQMDCGKDHITAVLMHPQNGAELTILVEFELDDNYW